MQTFTAGWIKDVLDTRDIQYKAGPNIVSKLQSDLRLYCSPVIDQGNIGSCTACATVALIQFVRNKQKYANWTPSPLFTYYASRLIENTVDIDSGASVRDAIKSTFKYGVAPELYWKYNTSKFKVKPPVSVWTEAVKHSTMQYQRIDNTNLNNLTSCINEGYPFVFGMNAYNSFISQKVASTGIVPIPNIKKESLLGGHCMLGVGYQTLNNVSHIIVQNSWGRNWGLAGFCMIPTSYLTNTNYADDFWTIRSTKN